MAYQFYLTVKGAKQGVFKGEGRRFKDKIDVLGFLHEVVSPRDIATGQASGKRQHKPLTILKEWGPATTQFYEALFTNESLTSVLLEAYHHSPNGVEELYFKITLTNAVVSDIRENLDHTLHGAVYDKFELEEISFTYHKIELENLASNTMAEDDWRATA